MAAPSTSTAGRSQKEDRKPDEEIVHFGKWPKKRQPSFTMASALLYRTTLHY